MKLHVMCSHEHTKARDWVRSPDSPRPCGSRSIQEHLHAEQRLLHEVNRPKVSYFVQETLLHSTSTVRKLHGYNYLAYTKPTDSIPGILTYMNVCSKSHIVSLKEWKCEHSPPFAALFSTRGGPFRLLLSLPCRLTRPHPGNLPGGLLEGSFGRRRRRRMPNQLNVGICARVLLPFQNAKTLSSAISHGGEKYIWPSGEAGAGGPAFCYTRNAKGLREPEKKGGLTPVELD